jgi:hypothetical protein
MTEPISAGQQLIADLQQKGDSYGLTLLIVEAARIADRLAKLNDLLIGEQTLWARLRENRDGDIYVQVDSALGEARQQAIALKQLLAEIQRQRLLAPPKQTQDDLAGL